MTFTIIQATILIFAIFALSRVILQFRKAKLTIKEFIFWCVIWCGIIVVALLPGISIFFAKIFGIQRGVDFLIYIGMVILFYLFFRMYVQMEQIEQNITKIVREVAIKRGKKK